MTTPEHERELAEVIFAAVMADGAGAIFDEQVWRNAAEWYAREVLASDWLRKEREKAAREALEAFADRFRPGDSNPWALHVRARARRAAKRIGADQ